MSREPCRQYPAWIVANDQVVGTVTHANGVPGMMVFRSKERAQRFLDNAYARHNAAVTIRPVVIVELDKPLPNHELIYGPDLDGGITK